MPANGAERGQVFLEGIDVVIRRDLGKHQAMLKQTEAERASFVEARDHESARKRHYYRLIGGGKYDDDALKKSVEQIRGNVRHLSDKVTLSERKIEHHTEIVDTLTQQLKDYDTLAAAVRQANEDAISH